jgi:hypothetical protein
MKLYSLHDDDNEKEKTVPKYSGGSKAVEQATNNPIALLTSILVLFFVLELVALGNLWAINAIADYF